MSAPPGLAGTPDILARILAVKAQEVASARAREPREALERRAALAPPPRGFAERVRMRAGTGRPAVIAEIKKASPSKGIIREHFEPRVIARRYEEAGACALSVLTDREFFQGAPEYLEAAREATSLPVLRKDFLLDPWQVLESRAMGADCVLLIVAGLPDASMHALWTLADQLGMDVLVEVHDAPELTRALAALEAVAPARPPLLGINNRDLRTFTTTLETTLALRRAVPGELTVVSESGIHTRADVARLREHGVHAFLVGEAFMRADDPGDALSALFGDEERPDGP